MGSIKVKWGMEYCEGKTAVSYRHSRRLAGSRTHSTV